MNILFCAYREWAKCVLATVIKHPSVGHVKHIQNNVELYDTLNSNHDFDLVLFCGWSSAPDEWAVNSIPMFTEHPATSDLFSEGTPIQNQILQGIKYSKHRLVKVGYPELSYRQYSHEVDIDLSGNMCDIVDQMRSTSIMLFNQFLDEYPDVTWHEWPAIPQNEQYEKRKPIDGQLTKEKLLSMTTKQMYDFFRMLEDPYPNACLEDEYGKLYFNKVSFKRK